MQAQRSGYHLRADEGVAVLVPADPRAELEDTTQLRSILRELACQLVLELSVRFEGRRDERVLEEQQCPLYLLNDLRATDSQLIGLPQNGDLLCKVLLQASLLLPREGRRLHGLEHLPDPHVLASDAPPHRLRRMCRHHEAHGHTVEHAL